MTESILPPLPADVDWAIRKERVHQDRKYGCIDQRPHAVMEWIAIMKAELAEAEDAWLHNGGDIEALKEVTQAVAVGVACMTQHGAYDRTGARRIDGGARRP